MKIISSAQRRHKNRLLVKFQNNKIFVLHSMIWAGDIFAFGESIKNTIAINAPQGLLAIEIRWTSSGAEKHEARKSDKQEKMRANVFLDFGGELHSRSLRPTDPVAISCGLKVFVSHAAHSRAACHAAQVRQAHEPGAAAQGWVPP